MASTTQKVTSKHAYINPDNTTNQTPSKQTKTKASRQKKMLKTVETSSKMSNGIEQKNDPIVDSPRQSSNQVDLEVAPSSPLPTRKQHAEREEIKFAPVELLEANWLVDDALNDLHE